MMVEDVVYNLCGILTKFKNLLSNPIYNLGYIIRKIIKSTVCSRKLSLIHIFILISFIYVNAIIIFFHLCGKKWISVIQIRRFSVYLTILCKLIGLIHVVTNDGES
jgi:hypothetical protein